MLFVSVSCPMSAMPPPSAPELLPVMTLSLIVTTFVAPAAVGLTRTPPPNGSNVTGVVVFTPPVIVMREIETVSVGPTLRWPIVITGPPPRTTVAPAPDPTRAMLFVIVMPPAKVPGPTLTCHRPALASTAAWTVG